jgi:hypothetical protein
MIYLKEKPISGIQVIVVLIELIVLLLLPLPFLKLNTLYVIFALIIMLISKYLRKEKWSQYGFKSIMLK